MRPGAGSHERGNEPSSSTKGEKCFDYVNMWTTVCFSRRAPIHGVTVCVCVCRPIWRRYDLNIKFNAPINLFNIYLAWPNETRASPDDFFSLWKHGNQPKTLLVSRMRSSNWNVFALLPISPGKSGHKSNIYNNSTTSQNKEKCFLKQFRSRSSNKATSAVVLLPLDMR
jgi:hypothetical protein